MASIGLVLFPLLLLLGASHPKISISPQRPAAISAGATIQFKADIPVNWSLAKGSPGSIDKDGAYHAPPHVPVKNSLAGCQLLPNDHILNTRIDTLPVNARSPEWLAGIPDGRLNYYPSWGTNIADSSTPKELMHFLYSPENDGKYETLPWPDLQRENGIFSGVHSDVDRHVVTADRETCQVFELYNNYPAGDNAQCATCTAQSGVAYSGMSYALPNTSTDAAGLFLAPLSIRLDEIRSGHIQHAGRFTLGNAFISPASSWPSRAHASAWGKIPYGTRFRLRPDYELSGFTPAAAVLLTQLKEYGLFLADGGANWEIQTSTDVTLDPVVSAALLEIRSRGPRAKDFQAVDESSLMLRPDSGEIARADDGSVTIIATDVNVPQNQSRIRLPLRGITVGVPRPSMWIQSGVTTQFKAWVNGAANASVIWTMTKTLGTLSANGDYTAPQVDRPTAVLLTAASVADPQSKASIAVTIMPGGPIRIKVGNATHAPGAPASEAPDYGPDSEGHIWWRDQAGEVSWGVANDDFSQPWPRLKDISLYYTSRYSFGDMLYRYLMPNGNYKISIYFAQPQCRNHFPKEIRAPIHLEAQGQIVLRDFDIGRAIDYACLTPEVISIPASVTDNSLYFALRRITLPKSAPSPLLSAYSITADNSPPKLAIDPESPKEMHACDQLQFYSVGWYMDSAASWSVDGPGSISADGLYTAPSVVPKSGQPVRVVARSKADPTKVAEAKFLLKVPDIPLKPSSATTTAIRIRCGDGPAFTDSQGHVWAADYGYSKDTVQNHQETQIADASPDMQTLYRGARYRYQDEPFSYHFDVPDGRYSVTLKFADYAHDEAGHYSFYVKLNGKKVLEHFDPDREKGPKHAVDKTFQTTVTDQSIRLDFLAESGAAFINGIEIIYLGP